MDKDDDKVGELYDITEEIIEGVGKGVMNTITMGGGRLGLCCWS